MSEDVSCAPASGTGSREPDQQAVPALAGFDPSRVIDLSGQASAVLLKTPEAHRGRRQTQVGAWCAAAFGRDHAASIPQRGVRLLEEAIEAAQAAGAERAMAHKLVDYVFDRPVGELSQELGGVGVTLLALAEAADLSAEGCECSEIARVLAKPLSHFAARNQSKNDAGFNVTPQADRSPKGRDAEERLDAQRESSGPEGMRQKDPSPYQERKG